MPTRLKIPTSVQSLGDAIRYLREQRGMTLRALAKRVEISAPFLSDIEHNRRNTDKLPAIADALGVDVKQLKKLDTRLPAHVKDWISANPEIIELLEDMQASGHTPAQLRASFTRRK
jgi:transcriptional regulator with XRE-family HTH domain